MVKTKSKIKSKKKKYKKEDLINVDLLMGIINGILEVGKEHELNPTEWKLIIQELKSWNDFNIAKGMNKAMVELASSEEIEDVGYAH